jgi:hypothetical protein
MPVENYNQTYLELLDEIEGMIMLHYYSGSKFDTPFWDFAKCRGENSSMKMMQNPKFRFIYEMSKGENPGEGLNPAQLNYAALIPLSYKINLSGLNLYNKLDKMI